jgi:hypothetical protein
LLKAGEKMAKSNAVVHIEDPSTSWLFNGFIIFSIGWMFLSIAFSGSAPAIDGTGSQASIISTE